MEVYAAQIDRMDQGIGRLLATLEKHGKLDDTLVIFLADNGACAEDIPQDVTIDELVDKLMIARRTTRSGEPVHFGNDVDAHARAGEHVPELRHGVGQPLEQPVSPLQALDPRGRHRDAADRALAERHRDERERHACATRRATCPTSWRRSSTSTGADVPASFDGHAVEPLEGQSLLPVFAQDTTGDDRKPMFWEHEGNAAVRIGKWKLVKRYPRAWELYDMDADRTELNDLASRSPSACRRWRRSTTRGRSAAACSIARRSWR